jgi:hypothetical protein
LSEIDYCAGGQSKCEALFASVIAKQTANALIRIEIGHLTCELIADLSKPKPGFGFSKRFVPW